MLARSQSAKKLPALEACSLDRGGRSYPTSTLLASSAGLGWSTISAELRAHKCNEVTITAPQQVEIFIPVVGNDDALVTIVRTGIRQQAAARSGAIWLNPIGTSYTIALSASVPKVMHLYLPTTTFRRLSDEFNLPGTSHHLIRDAAGIRDEVINNIALSLAAEMANETATSPMYADTASFMLAGHLIQRYCDCEQPAPKTPGAHPLDYARLRRVLDYMAEHISDQITLEGLASVACLSTFHFARVFTLAVGVPPHRYLSRMRLESAMAALAVGKLSLSEIALKACFSSQASFTRAFRRATGMTPGEYRQRRAGGNVPYLVVSDDVMVSDAS